MILVKMYHGSHLYGTATENSDVDYKGVGLASTTDVLLGRVPKVLQASSPAKADGAKNGPGDVDLQVFSLHAFIAMALKGETVAIDMLHAPRSKCIEWSDEWGELVDNRYRFYTRNMASLVGYARSQAAKYGLRGSRLAAAKAALWRIEAASELPTAQTVGAHMANLYIGEHVRWIDPEPRNHDLALYEVCGMKFQETAKLAYVAGRIKLFIDKYGERAKLAETNKGVDWKAVSHAFRAAYQVRAILKDGGFCYPLPETEQLIRLKRGDIPYREAGPWLEDLIDQVDAIARESSLPINPDRDWSDWFTIKLTQRSIMIEGE